MKRVSIFLITVVLIAGIVGCGGNDYTSPSQDLEIRAWYDLDAVRNNLAGHHRLMNDLDSTTAGYEELTSTTANGGKGWQPIGTPDDPFTGTFDGQGHEIRDLFINRPDEVYVGVFGYVNEAIIECVGLMKSIVAASQWVGGMIGWNGGTVSNCYSTGNVTGTDDDVGGLIGHNEGTVSNCYSTSNVTGDWDVGGLVSTNDGTVRNSYSTGSVTGDDRIGGLVGLNAGIVSNSYSSANVTGDSVVGGLTGANYVEAIVSNSYSTGNVTGSQYVGGLVGRTSESTVTNSFWDIETSGQPTSDGGTGKTTAEMQDITTFLTAAWEIIGVSGLSERNPAYIWNIVDDETYPFLSWQPIS